MIVYDKYLFITRKIKNEFPDTEQYLRSCIRSAKEKGARAEISELFERNELEPDVHFTTWDDYAVMSMVESGLGVSILPELILKRVPYDIAAKSLDVEAFRKIGFCVKDMKTVPHVVRKFMEYLQYRSNL